MFNDYDFELEKICKTIQEKSYQNIGLQFPEGLKIYAQKIAKNIKTCTKANVIICGDPCYGACDLPINLMGDINLLVHFGHSKIPGLKPKIPTLFIETRSKIDITKILKRVIKEELKEKRSVGIITTTQHIHNIPIIQNLLAEYHIKGIVGKGDSRITHKGQVLGCNLSVATSITSKVDCFLFIGSGNFHPLAVSLATGKDVIIGDPYTNEIRNVKMLKEKILRQRSGAIARAINARSFGILIGTKVGQKRIKLARKMKKLVEKNGRKAYLIVMNNFQPENLRAFKDVDAFISTACPRIAIDDYLKYDKTILTPIECEILFEVKKWENYQFDQIIG